MAADPAPATRAVLFDYGLTLVAFEFPRDCLLQMLEQKREAIAAASGGRPVPPASELLTGVLEAVEARLPRYGDEEVHYLGFFEQAWRAAGLDLPWTLLYEILDAEQLCWDRAVTVAPGMFHVLHRLRERGLKTAICSNAPFPPEMMRRQVAGLGLEALMDTIVFSSEIGRRKPAPEPYQVTLERLQVQPANALFVGDRVREDYEGPRALGMRAVLCTALATHPAPPQVPAIGTLEELEAWL